MANTLVPSPPVNATESRPGLVSTADQSFKGHKTFKDNVIIEGQLSGLVTATGGNTARSLAERFGDVKNVRDLGAKGDGITDDTEAIQAADAAALIAGGEVLVPGPCYVSSDVTLASRVRFTGTGAFTGPGRVFYRPAKAGSESRRFWADEATPWIAGRSGRLSPENTFYSFDAAVAAGIILEMDVWRTADNALVVHHDLTTTRTTGVTLDVTKAKIEDLRTLNAAATWDANIFPRTPIPTLHEVIVRYGSTVPMIIEIKGDEMAATLAARLVKTHGLQASVVISSFGEAQHDAVRAVDSSIRTMKLASAGTGIPSVADLVARRVWGVGIEVSQVTAQYVTDCHAAGIKVFAWAIDYVYPTEATLLSIGVDGVYTDVAPYMRQLINASTPSGTAIAPPYNVFGSGWRVYKSANPTVPGNVVSGGYATFDQATAPIASEVFLIYPGIRTPEGTYTVETTLKLQKASATTANKFGLRFGFASDQDTGYLGRPASEGEASNGYLFVYGPNGEVRLRRVDANVMTDIAAAVGGWALLGEGATVQVRLQVTPTTITVTNLGTGQVITATDSTHPRRGFISIFGAGQVPGVGTTTLTY